jgi:DNA-binding response OmpR family regulator
MDLDGTQIIALLGHRTSASTRLPVIGLTRRGDLMAKLAAFEAGVDDILIVPFAPEELLARVIAVLRRFYCAAVTFTPVIKIGELEIDILKQTVRAGTSELHLTSLEQSLLYLLAANAGRVVTREEILDTHQDSARGGLPRAPRGMEQSHKTTPEGPRAGPLQLASARVSKSQSSSVRAA